MITYGELKKIPNLEQVGTAYFPGYIPKEENEDLYKVNVTNTDGYNYYFLHFPHPGTNSLFIQQSFRVKV